MMPKKSSTEIKPPRPQNAYLQPGVHQQGIRDASGPVLEPGEASERVRVRAPIAVMEWFARLSPLERGAIAARAMGAID
jgi:hypothetical protein